jgi:predicted ATPase
MDPEFKGSVTSGDDWIKATNKVTAIYGPNGSGKSTILNAIDFMRTAVHRSATEWADDEDFPHEPFLLDGEHEDMPSLYELDIVVDKVRYTFGFEATARAIQSEWLYSYPTRRRRVLYTRIGQDFTFGRSFTGESQMLAKMTDPNQLLMSVGAAAKNKLLTQIRHVLMRHMLYARFDEKDRQSRLAWIKDYLMKNESVLADTQKLVGLADLGITGLSVDRDEISPAERERIANEYAQILKVRGIEPNEKDIQSAVDQLERNVKLTHISPSQGAVTLQLEQESSGTIAWLSLLVPALHAIRRGLVFMVDELDASLHPRLSAMLIELFNDPNINKSGGQLLFTSHDTSLLGKNLGGILRKEEVWFTEKNGDGATSLYALDEFTVREIDNLEKRYLDGRYGALPVIELESIRRVLSAAQ